MNEQEQYRGGNGEAASVASETLSSAMNGEVSDANAVPAKTKKPRGFAAMDRERVRQIASVGGKAAHAHGTAHQFTTEEARAAGRLGGIAPHRVRGRGKRSV